MRRLMRQPAVVFVVTLLGLWAANAAIEALHPSGRSATSRWTLTVIYALLAAVYVWAAPRIRDSQHAREHPSYPRLVFFDAVGCVLVVGLLVAVSMS